MEYIPYGYHYLDADDLSAVNRVLRSEMITQGSAVADFEQSLASYCGSRFAVAVSSGTAALHLACLAAGIKKGDEVITSPLTFVASANCVLYCAGRPVFADVQEDTLNLDPVQIDRKVTHKTKAIIPVHFAGHPCDLMQIARIARKDKLTVIEDAAHALGAQYRSSRIGSCRYSDMAIFSFHPVKSITTGEGGAVLTNRRDLYEKLVMLRSHGITRDSSQLTIKNSKSTGEWYYEMQYLGFNYRITDFQCAMGISQLKKISKFIARRRYIAGIYGRGLSGIRDICLPQERPYVRTSRHLYYIRLKDPAKRRGVFNKLRKAGIGVNVHYIPVHLQPYYRENLGTKEGDCPVAEKYYRSAITLPLYPKMTDAQARRVINELKEAL